MGYREKEQAVIDAIYAAFSEQMDHTDQVVAGDIDTLLTQLFGESKKYGCLLDFGGGSRSFIEPFKKKIWNWSIIGVFMLRYTGEIKEVEDELREIIEILATLFEGDHTLDGKTPWVRIERIDQPEVTQMNDVPMYWLPFEIRVVEGPDF